MKAMEKSTSKNIKSTKRKTHKNGESKHPKPELERVQKKIATKINDLISKNFLLKVF
jgi:hypothetical protein